MDTAPALPAHTLVMEGGWTQALRRLGRHPEQGPDVPASFRARPQRAEDPPEIGTRGILRAARLRPLYHAAVL